MKAAGILSVMAQGSNRTFMELKFGSMGLVSGNYSF